MSTNNAASAGAAGVSTAIQGEAPVAPAGAIGGTLVANAKVAITPFTKAKDADLVIAINRVIAQMTGNAVYPAPVPTLASVAAARDAFAVAVNGLDRSRASTVRRNAARAAVLQQVRDLALYVQHTCAGDAGKLLSSGFTAQRTRQRNAAVLGPPRNVRLQPGELSGQILARCARLDGARAYQWRYALASAPAAWTELDTVMTASTMLQGLTRGVDYLVQVRAFGTRGPSDWSDAATMMVV